MRQLQVLAVVMNEVQQTVIVTFSIVAAIPLAGIGLVVVIHCFQNNNADYVLLGLAAVLIMNAYFGLSLIYGVMSQLPEKSNELVVSVSSLVKRNMYSGLEKKIIRKFVKSCTPVRAKFGLGNIVDKLTPLICIDQTNALAVNLLLLSQ